MTIFLFALKRSFRNPVNILLLCVLPVGIVFVPVVPGLDPARSGSTSTGRSSCSRPSSWCARPWRTG